MPKLELSIVLDEQFKIHVSGPLENKLICLGMIELAKQTILQFDAAKKIVEPPPGAVLPAFGRFGG